MSKAVAGTVTRTESKKVTIFGTESHTLILKHLLRLKMFQWTKEIM